MGDFDLNCEVRTVVGKKVNRLRANGMVPASVYGPKNDPIKVQIPYRPLEVALMKAGGTNLIDLNVDGNTFRVLAREVQRDVLKTTILHVDFFAVDITSKIRADIPVHLVGESPVVEARQGILLTGTNTVTIEAFPDKLMNFIEVDLSRLVELGDSITVADLDFGDDILIINDPEDMLARVSQTSAARSALLESMDEEAEAAAEVGPSEPELVSRGRDDDEDED